jgi:hypothetical protein
MNEKQEQKAPTVRNKGMFYFAPLVLYFSFVSDIGRCPMLVYDAPLVLKNACFFKIYSSMEIHIIKNKNVAS